MRRDHKLIASGLSLLLMLLFSAIHPYDRTTWLLEIAPILIALPLLVVSYKRFPLTGLLYTLIFAHVLILIAGGVYSYARVPLGFWIQDALSLSRNPYDKIGHFAQGFVPFIVAREILLRGGYMANRRMVAFVSVCFVMMISSSYELIEWWSALLLGQGAEEFLGTQGDPWDTQSDMFFALIGATASLLTLSHLHDKQIARMKSSFVERC